jgi:hypothetical protein
MVVRTPVPSGLQLFSPVEVAVECGGTAIVVAGQVLQIFPGIGVAVGLDRPARDRIEGLAGGGRGGEPDAEAIRELAAQATSGAGEIDVELSARLARGTAKPGEPGASSTPGTPEARRDVAVGSSPAIDRIQLALRGDREQRLAILRDRHRAVHVYVLRNPGLTFDEIVAIARMPTVAPEVLTQIAERREWGQKPDVAMALIRNPATPTPVAVRLIDFVSETDLRLLAKDTRTREPIQRAARKKLLS